MSGDLLERIINQRGSFENLMTRIPLLGDKIESYYDMSAQRDADRIIRDHIASQLRQEINRMAAAENTILDGGGLAYMSKTRSAKQRFQTLADRIGTAAPGYAFTGALKVGQAELGQIYAFDEAMLEYVDKIRQAVDTLVAAAGAGEGIEEALAALNSVVAEAGQVFDARKNVLNGLNS